MTIALCISQLLCKVLLFLWKVELHATRSILGSRTELRLPKWWSTSNNWGSYPENKQPWTNSGRGQDGMEHSGKLLPYKRFICQLLAV